MEINTIQKFYEVTERLVRDEIRLTGTAISRVFGYGEDGENSMLTSAEIPDKGGKNEMEILMQIMETKDIIVNMIKSIESDDFKPLAFVHIENVITENDRRLVVSKILKNDDTNDYGVMDSKVFEIKQSVSKSGVVAKLELVDIEE